MQVRRSSTPYPNTKKCRSCLPSSPDSDSSPQRSRPCSLSMKSSAIIASLEMDSMDSLLPECEFPSLQVARRGSSKVKFGDRSPRVSDGTSVSPASISVHHAMPCSSLVCSVSLPISKLDSEMNDVKSDETVLASSDICCEGLHSDAFGCHMDSDGFIPTELRNMQFGNLNA
ncbi:hypothetical protein Nepgr_014824 [Nepenthes gracilis]|uniref:Uncharacterized protein n=1 Tax=Nepenthes gracilis TaxID=150966 RepID=A0AAD3SKQ0_NEPGR|nr:hypothetical protein Nepgr_014824 [Nepenthes gracilis]